MVIIPPARRTGVPTRYIHEVVLGLSLVLVGLWPATAEACTTCDAEVGQQVRAGLFAEAYMLEALWLLVPFGMLSVLAAWLHGAFPHFGTAMRQRLTPADCGPLVAAGLFLGLGLGGFLDGIVFHQLLQLHSMLSARLLPTTLVAADINMFWDGLFHLFCYAATIAGVILLWRAASRRTQPGGTRAVLGASLAGFGYFNLAEGLVDHQIVGLHHVVERAARHQQLGFDLAFLVSGVLLLAVGLRLVMTEQR